MGNDQVIIEEVRGALERDPRIALAAEIAVAAVDVAVAVADGRLTLKGEVKRQHESTAAFDVVSRVAGVGGITKAIKVVSPGVDG